MRRDDPTNTVPNQMGNLGRNTYRGPGFAQVDFSLIKNTTMPWFTPEGAQFQIRVETFHLLNRVNLSNFNTSRSSGTFGQSTGANEARTIQLGLRMVF